MVKRRVTPTTGVIGQCIVRRAEIGGRDYNSTRQTPRAVALASDLETRAAAKTVVEQSGA